jgi:hypothetical protein
MATPITLVDTGNGLDIRITTPGGEQMSLSTALTHFRCSPNASAGLRLAGLAVSALARVTTLGRLETLTPKVGRQMPLLFLKDELFRLVERCNSCLGTGCNMCHQTGFRQ